VLEILTIDGSVLGILAVTRSFGDHGMKDFVTANPHLNTVNLSTGDRAGSPFLILACDGVWDVLSDQEAVDMLMEEFKSRGGPFNDAAEMLVSCI
jgi:serine/threonine protein phosphatase PrpC